MEIKNGKYQVKKNKRARKRTRTHKREKQKGISRDNFGKTNYTVRVGGKRKKREYGD